MKNTTRLLALSLCAALSLSFAVGCNCANSSSIESSIDSSSQSSIEDAETEKVVYTKGVHDFTAPDTDKDFVKNGTTNYVIVIPENSSAILNSARDELTYFFKMATDITLKSITDDEIEKYTNYKYISIGETDLLSKSGLTVDKAYLGADGYNIFTGDDDTIYLIGGTDYGSIYSVYTFLDIYFHFESYYADCYEIDMGVRNLKLKDFQVTDKPDFKKRALGYGIYKNDATYDIANFRYRMGMAKERGEDLMPIYKEYNNTSSPRGQSTNADYYFPYETYCNPDKPDTYHPNWFSTACTNGDYQFCYTARGDAEEYRLMVEECAKKIENSLMIYPRATYGSTYTAVSMTTQDNHNVCKCTQCKADEKKYGYGGMVARFINDVGEVLEDWMEQPENEPYKRENFRIIFFAYLEYSVPPISYDEENDTWVPVDDSVYLRDNVGVYLAPARNFAYEQNVYAEENDKGREVVEGWAQLTDCIYLWTYCTNFAAYMYLSDTFSMWNSEGYQYFCDKNVEMIVNQGPTNNPYSTAWNGLKMYLDAKLQWDCTLDTQELTDNYFKAMYGDASNKMKELFAKQLTYTRKVYTDAGFYSAGSGTTDTGVHSVNYWPLTVIQSWVDDFDEAKKLLDKNNPKYQMYIDHIEWETLSPLYMAIALYGQETSKMPTAIKRAYKERLAKDIEYFEISNMLVKETGGYIGDVLKN